jgi:calcium-dependent protein kinase
MANEIEILSFCDHPHIIRLHHTFEDDSEVHIAMQECSGGELANILRTDGPFCENDVRVLMHQLLSGVCYLHDVRHIAHRDLKLENILLSAHNQKLSQSHLKIIDFGFAEGFQPGIKSFDAICGTPSYIAPETVLGGSYDEKCDIWSCGVLLYQMTSGRFPFSFDTKVEYIHDGFSDDFFQGKLYFLEEQWKSCSGNLKLTIKRMCAASVQLRFSAAKVLDSEWFRCMEDETVEELMSHMHCTCRMLKELHKLACKSLEKDSSFEASLESFLQLGMEKVAYNLKDEEFEEERKLFEAADSNSNGMLELDEWMQFTSCCGMPNAEATKLFCWLDVDKSGSIAYTEFLSAVLRGRECRKEALLAAFDDFDSNHDGLISFDDLKSALSDNGTSDEDCRAIFEEAHSKHSGELDFEEFQRLLPCAKALSGRVSRKLSEAATGGA